jgi:hypothetical protein
MPFELICPICNEEKEGFNICDDCINIQRSKWVEHGPLTLPGAKWDELCGMYSADTLTKDKARGIFEWDGKLFLNHGGGFAKKNWDGKGGARTGKIFCTEVVHEEHHEGPKLTYGELDLANGNGPWHTNNQIVHCRGKTYVSQPYQGYYFVPDDKPDMEQGALF